MEDRVELDVGDAEASREGARERALAGSRVADDREPQWP
jgi:hypothetical protein